jgi:hypothetical protein
MYFDRERGVVLLGVELLEDLREVRSWCFLGSRLQRL